MNETIDLIESLASECGLVDFGKMNFIFVENLLHETEWWTDSRWYTSANFSGNNANNQNGLSLFGKRDYSSSHLANAIRRESPVYENTLINCIIDATVTTLLKLVNIVKVNMSVESARAVFPNTTLRNFILKVLSDVTRLKKCKVLKLRSLLS